MSNLKDKRIVKEGLVYVAEVHWYDGHVTHVGRFTTLKLAQKALSKFPSDVFEGFDNPSGERAMAHMDSVRKERRPPPPRPRARSKKKQLPEYVRLYDKRCR